MGRARGVMHKIMSGTVAEREERFSALFGTRRGTGAADPRFRSHVSFLPNSW